MRQFGRYILCTFVVLIGVSWFFQKINKYDFYTRYFRIIAEINVRNSHTISPKKESLTEYKNIVFKQVHTSRIVLFLAKTSLSQRLSSADARYLHISLPTILYFLSAKMKESIPFSIAPPVFLAD